MILLGAAVNGAAIAAGGFVGLGLQADSCRIGCKKR